MERDEYLALAERELDEAVNEWNETGETLSPDGRVRLAQVYALTSIARSLCALAGASDSTQAAGGFPPADAGAYDSNDGNGYLPTPHGTVEDYFPRAV